MSTQVADYTYINTFATCPRRGYYAYELGLESREKSAPLHAGSALHAALHVLYTQAWDLDAALDALRASWGDFMPAPASKWRYLTLGHCEIVLRNYADDHQHDRFKVLAVDGQHLAEQAVVIDWDGVAYGGKPDLPIALDGGTYVLDFKTTSAWVNDWWAAKFEMSHQFRGYAKLMSERMGGQRFDGAYIMGIYVGEYASDDAKKWASRKSKRSQLLGPYLFSPAHVLETREWAQRWLATISEWRARSGTDGAAAFPQNEGQNCTSCAFKELCKAQPQARSQLAMLHYRKRTPSGVLLSGADDVEEAA